MIKPIAVLTSDIHFNLNTLPLASQALKAALSKAEDLKVPLVIAGDLHDTKAIIRAEVMNALLDIIDSSSTRVFILVGNHDLINEKGSEHGLHYLQQLPDVSVVDKCGDSEELPGVAFFPYQNSSEDFKRKILNVPKGHIIICHQGFLGAAMGDYVQDKTSIDPELVKDFTVISGHYHRHQTIGSRTKGQVDGSLVKTFHGPGTVTYIGSPFTMSFGEANDGPKGFLVLNSDGTFTREILNLRKHVKIECSIIDLIKYGSSMRERSSDDLVWVKVSGPYSELQSLDKKALGSAWHLTNFKLDLIPTDSAPLEIPVENLSAAEVFDRLIDNTSESDEQKSNLKRIWREVIESDS